MDNPEELKTIVPDLKIELKKERDKLKVLLDGEDVSEEIRRPEMGMAASRVSRHRVIREKLWELQRKLGEKGGVVAEGRDMGTVVFPHAEFKFFVTASAEERARRRFKILAEVKERDEQDSKRELAPLKSAEDAIIVDTTEMTLEQVVDKLLKIILEKDFQK